MKLTLVFPSGEGYDLSVGPVFAPCAIWKIGRRTLLNPHRENPHYLPGDFQELLSVLKSRKYIARQEPDHQGEKIYVIVHEIGHGIKSYLADLTSDIVLTGYTPVVV